jgi:hypothetical protein
MTDAFWAAVVTGILTISGTMLGVFFTLKNNRACLKDQLTHDTDERNKERALSMRREIYLAAAEAIAKTQEHLIRLAELELSEFNNKLYDIGLAQSINKIHLIGSEKTIEAVSVYTRKYSEALMALYPDKLLLMKLQEELASLDNIINRLLTSRSEMLEQLKAIHDISENKSYVESLMSKLNESKGQLDELFKHKAEKQAQIIRARLTLIDKSRKHSFDIGESLADAAIAARTEMGHPLDEKYYRQLIEQNRTSLDKSYKEYLQKIGLHPV